MKPKVTLCLKLMSKKSREHREHELISEIETYLDKTIGVTDSRQREYEANKRYYIAYSGRSFAFNECSETKQDERLDELEEILAVFKGICEK